MFFAVQVVLILTLQATLTVSKMIMALKKDIGICYSPTLKIENNEFVWITLTVNE